MLCAVGFSLIWPSCANKGKQENAAVNGQGLTANGNYRSTTQPRPVPQNPHIGLSSDISGAASDYVSHGSRSQKYIALTFDDGPNPRETPRLLDMLRSRNIKATFYVVGRSAASHPNIIRRIVAEGHEIGNHTWDHKNLKTLSDAQVRWQLDKTRNAIVSASGVRPRTMRPPYGAMYPAQRAWVYREYGYPAVLWDVDPEDWRKPGASVIADRLIRNTRNGSILLLHDLHGSSVDAVPQTLDTLLRQGYQFVTVSQLIAASGGGVH